MEKQTELAVLRAEVEAVEALETSVVALNWQVRWDEAIRIVKEAMRSAMETQMMKGQNAAT